MPIIDESKNETGTFASTQESGECLRDSRSSIGIEVKRKSTVDRRSSGFGETKASNWSKWNS